MRVGVALTPAPSAQVVFAKVLLHELQLAGVAYGVAVHASDPAGRAHVLHASPVVKNVLQQRVPAARIRLRGVLRHQSLKFS